MIEKLFDLMVVLCLFTGLIGLIVMCVLANVTPGNDVYGEWALGALALLAASVLLSGAT